MYPQSHFLLPFFLGVVLTKFNILNWKLALIGGLVGVLVDVDHFFEHIFHKKKNKFSLRDTWNNSVHYHWFSERSFIHHWQGILLCSLVFLVIGWLNWKIVLVLGLGYYTHIISDNLYTEAKPKKILKFKKEGFFIQIPYYEIIFDAALVLGIVVVFI